MGSHLPHLEHSKGVTRAGISWFVSDTIRELDMVLCIVVCVVL